MKYRLKRHITNTLLYAVIITALIAIISNYNTIHNIRSYHFCCCKYCFAIYQQIHRE